MGGPSFTPSVSRRRSGYDPRTSMTRASMPRIDSSNLRSRIAATNVPNGRTLTTNSPSPLVFALDATGSMGDWVEIIYTKLPMLYGQLVENSVLEKLAVSLCLFTDAGIGNQDPFQIADFAEGDILDESIESLWLPLKNGVDCGGGNGMESYEMVAYYYLHHCDLKGSQNPFFFMTGDEGYYPKVDSFLVSNHFGSLKKGVSLDSLTVLQELARKFECFILRKPYHNGEKRVNDSWVRAWGPHRVLMLNEPAQVADTVIGAVALTKGVWTLERYLAVLQERNQTRDRIANVRETLLPYAEYLSRP